ncbi:hypothetical protein D3C77_646170 [compost metagenome]
MERCAGAEARNLLGLHGGDIDAIVKSFNARAFPAGEVGTHLVTHRIGNAE